MNPKLAQILQVIDSQLLELHRLHIRLKSTYDGVAENCKISPEDAVTRIDSALGSYGDIIKTLKELEHAGQAEGADLANDLRVATERQVTVEKERREWLQNAISQHADSSPPGCPDGVVPTDQNQANAERDNVQAMSLKTDFANRYSSISPHSVDPNDI